MTNKTCKICKAVWIILTWGNMGIPENEQFLSLLILIDFLRGLLYFEIDWNVDKSWNVL